MTVELCRKQQWQNNRNCKTLNMQLPIGFLDAAKAGLTPVNRCKQLMPSLGALASVALQASSFPIKNKEKLSKSRKSRPPYFPTFSAVLVEHRTFPLSPSLSLSFLHLLLFFIVFYSQIAPDVPPPSSSLSWPLFHSGDPIPLSTDSILSHSTPSPSQHGLLELELHQTTSPLK